MSAGVGCFADQSIASPTTVSSPALSGLKPTARHASLIAKPISRCVPALWTWTRRRIHHLRCDDSDGTVYPGAPGTAGVDNNCDGVLSESEAACPLDLDGDLAVTVSDVLSLLSEFGCGGVHQRRGRGQASECGGRADAAQRLRHRADGPVSVQKRAPESRGCPGWVRRRTPDRTSSS